MTARTNRGHHDSSLPAVYIQLRHNMDIANKKKTSRREKSHEALAPHHGCNMHAASRMWRGDGCTRDSAAAYVCFLLHPSVSEEKDKLSQLLQGPPPSTHQQQQQQHQRAAATAPIARRHAHCVRVATPTPCMHLACCLLPIKPGYRGQSVPYRSEPKGPTPSYHQRPSRTPPPSAAGEKP